ncbi:MAG: hypothetical protein JXQ72_00525 [Anaerolineae bacterium]|nr:hypothetical protein [Anaerolineae bacterium]
MARRKAGFKAALHPWLDPALSLPDRWRAGRALAGLPDGTYRVPVDVPYYAQFASPERIYDYIHHGYDGTQDPRWQQFGADDPAIYAFWAPRICAVACIKMAVEAFYPNVQPPLWELVKAGLEVNGYRVRDSHGRWVDQGWYYHAQAHLANAYRLEAAGQGYVSPLSVCRYIRAGWLVGATVSSDIGERPPVERLRYGGHVVLVYGFRWINSQPAHYYLHNPSGRFPELQSHAEIPAARFDSCFAHRLVALRPAGQKIQQAVLYEPSARR